MKKNQSDICVNQSEICVKICELAMLHDRIGVPTEPENCIVLKSTKKIKRIFSIKLYKIAKRDLVALNMLILGENQQEEIHHKK